MIKFFEDVMNRCRQSIVHGPQPKATGSISHHLHNDYTNKKIFFCRGLRTVVRGLTYAMGGWNGESINFSLNSAWYSVEQIESGITSC
jgi:hypothetical protein